MRALLSNFRLSADLPKGSAHRTHSLVSVQLSVSLLAVEYNHSPERAVTDNSGAAFAVVRKNLTSHLLRLESDRDPSNFWKLHIEHAIGANAPMSNIVY